MSLRAAPVAVELAAFLEASFYGHVLEVEGYLRVLLCHALQEFTRGLVGKIALDVDGAYFAVGQKFAHAVCQFHQQHARILAAAHRDEHLVTVLD